MSDKKTCAEGRAFTVSILGKKYSLLTDEKQETIEEAARLISSCLDEIGGAAAKPSDLVKKTTFVALKIAVDLIKSQKRLRGFSEKTTSLNNLLKDSFVESDAVSSL